MKLIFENYGKTITIELDNDSSIEEVIDAIHTGLTGIGFPSATIAEGMYDKYDELKD